MNVHVYVHDAPRVNERNGRFFCPSCRTYLDTREGAPLDPPRDVTPEETGDNTFLEPQIGDGDQGEWPTRAFAKSLSRDEEEAPAITVRDPEASHDPA